MFGEFDRGFHRNVAIQIAGVAGAHPFDALAAQAEGFAALGAFGNVDGRFAAECGHINFAPQCGGGHAHRHLAVQIVAVAFKDVVFAQANLDVQIARRAAVLSRLTVACAADALAVVDAGGYFDFQRFLLFDLALTAAGGAGVGNDFAGAPAVRAGLLHAEETLAHLHHPLTIAGATGFGARAGLGAAAVAGTALVPRGDLDLGFFAIGRFFQRDFHGVRQIAAAKHLAPAALATASAPKDVAKDVAKGLRETPEPFTTTAASAHVRVHARVAVLVVGRFFLRVGQDLVGLFGFFEFFFGRRRRFTLVAVGVVLHRELAISLFDLVFRSVLGHAQHFVKIAFRHGGSVGCMSTNAA